MYIPSTHYYLLGTLYLVGILIERIQYNIIYNFLFSTNK